MMLVMFKPNKDGLFGVALGGFDLLIYYEVDYSHLVGFVGNGFLDLEYARFLRMIFVHMIINNNHTLILVSKLPLFIKRALGLK